MSFFKDLKDTNVWILVLIELVERQLLVVKNSLTLVILFPDMWICNYFVSLPFSTTTMRKSQLFFTLIILATLLASFLLIKLPPKGKQRSSMTAAESMSARDLMKEIRAKAAEAKAFTAQKGFNTSVCFLIDMSLPSGQNRFFVYNMETDSLLKSGLVAHGRCNQEWLEGRKYGNTVGCGCTSLGKYRVGYAYNGRFGEAFKLYGLEQSNDKAFDRFVVLHSYEGVPFNETTDEICQSDGCPMVAPGFLRLLKPVIKGSDKPILLWIYE